MALKKVISEVSGTIFSLPYYVARETGYFTDEGLDVELVRRPEGAQGEDAGVKLIRDHHLVDSFGGGAGTIFEQGASALYRACEWGQVRRAQDSEVGGQVIAKRASKASQAIIVRLDSPYNIPQDLANVQVGVNFHHGSHYIALQMLEGFLPREEIKLVHIAGKGRFEALRDGDVDAVAVMEPWITVAEKLGYKIIAEAHYTGLEVANPNLDADTFAAINRAIHRAVVDLQTDPYPYVKYLIKGVPEEIVKLEPHDFSRTRLRYTDPSPYSDADFARTYNWLVSWGLAEAGDSYDRLVDNRVSVPA